MTYHFVWREQAYNGLHLLLCHHGPEVAEGPRKRGLSGDGSRRVLGEVPHVGGVDVVVLGGGQLHPVPVVGDHLLLSVLDHVAAGHGHGGVLGALAAPLVQVAPDSVETGKKERMEESMPNEHAMRNDIFLFSN